jgi:hypothetical protein
LSRCSSTVTRGQSPPPRERPARGAAEHHRPRPAAGHAGARRRARCRRHVTGCRSLRHAVPRADRAHPEIRWVGRAGLEGSGSYVLCSRSVPSPAPCEEDPAIIGARSDAWSVVAGAARRGMTSRMVFALPRACRWVSASSPTIGGSDACSRQPSPQRGGRPARPQPAPPAWSAALRPTNVAPPSVAPQRRTSAPCGASCAISPGH